MSSIRSFVPLQKLGEGTYSNVYKVRRVDDGQIYALKKVKLNSLSLKQKENALNQVRILASIESSNIIAYKEAFFDEALNVLCVVMEHANDGDLQKLIQTHAKTSKPIQQPEIWKAAQHTLKGLENLHSRGILHRDIKCANIFKSKGVYKLGDLNVSKVNGDKLAYTQTGTPYYASPEVWRDEPYDSKSDIWSFGCILYEMATLKPPFNGKDMEDLFKNVQKAKVPPLNSFYSRELEQFIQLCLQRQPEKRPSASELLKQLKKQSSNATSGIKINNPESNQLLKTIKVPQDLKKLNEALPTSKYRKSSEVAQNKTKQQLSRKIRQSQSMGQNKSSIVYSKMSPNTINTNKKDSSIIVLQQQQDHIIETSQVNDKRQGSNKLTKQNKSAIHLAADKVTNSKQARGSTGQNGYCSPKGRVQSSNRLYKSPASQVRLGKKVESNIGYSERQHASDRKPSTASKVQRVRHQMQIDIKKLAEQLKKPISMPRTQKKATLINNSHLIQSPFLEESQLGMQKISNNLSYGPVVISQNIRGNVGLFGANRSGDPSEAWRNKLVKKNRILSSNQSKPSWW